MNPEVPQLFSPALVIALFCEGTEMIQTQQPPSSETSRGSFRAVCGTHILIRMCKKTESIKSNKQNSSYEPSATSPPEMLDRVDQRTHVLCLRSAIQEMVACSPASFSRVCQTELGYSENMSLI